MHVGFNSEPRSSFGSVNMSYLKRAAHDYRHGGCIGVNWFHNLMEDVFLSRKISVQDAVDTVNASRRYVSKESIKVFDEYSEQFKSAYD